MTWVLGRPQEDIEPLLRQATPAQRRLILDGLQSELRAERAVAYKGASLASFAHDCIKWPDGQRPAPYQSEIWEELPVRRKVAVRGPHGCAKSTTASIAVLGCALGWDADNKGDWKIPTTASVWYQLKQYLWPEIHKWARLVDWERLGREPFTKNELLLMELTLSQGKSFGASPKDASAIEGAHADHILYVFDEAKVIPVDVWDAAEGTFSGPGDYMALAISTPGDPSGRFYDIQSRKPGYEDWWVRHVTLEEAIAAGRISRDWAEQRARQWKVTSAVYQNRVLGQFASSDEDSVIPLAWAEAAVARWRDLETEGALTVDPLSTVGVDVARGGQDRTVFARRHGNVILELDYHDFDSTSPTAALLTGILVAHPTTQGIVDLGGLGAGVVDQGRQTDECADRITAFDGNRGTERKDISGELGMANWRSGAWWHLRELLDPDLGATLALPDDDLLVSDLTAPKWTIKPRKAGGVIMVEPKEHIKKRLGRSPDSGDAVAMACWPEWDDGDWDMSGFDSMLDGAPLR